ncbi:MAG: hypothetical protein A2X94_01710 [Bdellovibrionales bacterium GWB1_55_8]|nr:MAG: hypothetical protein A2X94_01710 [Bdellovibrionales bacterium GWB1_55_8]
MPKIRLVREREQNTEVSGDLRGLGNDPLLKDAFPRSVLMVKLATQSHPLHQLARLHGFSVEWHESQHLLSIAKRDPKDGEHKLDAVDLFTFLLSAFQKLGENFSASLIQWNILQSRMHDAIRNQEFSASRHLVQRWEQGHKDHALTLDAPSAHALHQSGFMIHPHATKNTHLSLNQLHEHREAVLREIRTSYEHSSERKAG